MIVLITAAPGSGKSTAISRFVHRYQEPMRWVITEPIPRPEGGRAGFMARDQGGTRVVSHKTDIDSPIIIGKNRVDVEAVDAMFSDVLSEPDHDKLLVIDEIGPIQMLSERFARSLDSVLNNPQRDVIATIHYADERFEQYRNSPDILLLHLTLENRDALPGVLQLLADRRHSINELPQALRQKLYAMLEVLVAKNLNTQIKKLLNNTISYIQRGAIRTYDSGHYQVVGNHGTYDVTTNGTEYVCTCDLFLGLGKYAGQAGECSHIQAVRLEQAS